MENMKVLAEITDNLPNLSDLVTKECEGTIEYDVKYGTALGFQLYNINEIAVQRVCMSKDTVFDDHTHNVHEYGILYKGELKIIASDFEKIMKPGDFVYFVPNNPHKAIALKDSWGIWITIPSGKGYPNTRVE